MGKSNFRCSNFQSQHNSLVISPWHRAPSGHQHPETIPTNNADLPYKKTHKKDVSKSLIDPRPGLLEVFCITSRLQWKLAEPFELNCHFFLPRIIIQSIHLSSQKNSLPYQTEARITTKDNKNTRSISLHNIYSWPENLLNSRSSVLQRLKGVHTPLTREINNNGEFDERIA
jgi:hypothetical protein